MTGFGWLLEAAQLLHEDGEGFRRLLDDLGAGRINQEQTAAELLSSLQLGKYLCRRLELLRLLGIQRTAFRLQAVACSLRNRVA